MIKFLKPLFSPLSSSDRHFYFEIGSDISPHYLCFSDSCGNFSGSRLFCVRRADKIVYFTGEILRALNFHVSIYPGLCRN